MSEPRVTAVCVVHELLPDPGGSVGRTAIDKRPVDGPVQVGLLRLGSDVQCDERHHGGRDQAVYAYADEDAAWWARELGREITAGLFGENLRTTGLDVNGAQIGERWQIGQVGQAGPAAGQAGPAAGQVGQAGPAAGQVGQAGPAGPLLLEVTAPRIPCATFQRRMAEPRWVKRFTAHGAPGTYLRVLNPGWVQAGDPVVVTHRPGHGVSVRDAFLGAEPDRMRRLLAAADSGLIDLHPPLRELAAKVAARG